MIEQYSINSFTNCVFAYDGIDTKSYKIIAIETTFDTCAACRLFFNILVLHMIIALKTHMAIILKLLYTSYTWLDSQQALEWICCRQRLSKVTSSNDFIVE